MIDPYLGSIEAFGFSFAPRGWMQCDGQILPINQNQSLYSLLGTIYGGDGRTTFALPDLRGRTSLHFGTGSGLSPRSIGQRSGQENHILTVQEIPSHNHTALGSNQVATATSPKSGVPATTPEPGKGEEKQLIYDANADLQMTANMIENTGGGQGHNNMQPYLVTNWCICINGLFPPRN